MHVQVVTGLSEKGIYVQIRLASYKVGADALFPIPIAWPCLGP